MLRSLEGIEKRFGNPLFSSVIQFALKCENQTTVEKIVNNFNKIFLGLRLRISDEHYAKASEETIINNVLKLPMWIQDCKTACDWMNENYNLPVTERLTTIASNNRIIVVNSNHNVSDSGFILNAVEHCLDDNILDAFYTDPNLSPEEKLVPIRESVAFKTEIDRAERKSPQLHPYPTCTSFPYDINDDRFAKREPVSLHFDDQISIEKLVCYDKKLKRPKQMNELLWTAITMNQLAMAINKEGSQTNKNQPLSLPIIVDTRKFKDDQSKVNWRYTNCVSAANLLVEPSAEMKISDIFNLFRKDLNMHIKDGFYYWINHGNFIGTPGRAYGMNSSIGTVKINPPLIDFFIQSHEKISKDLEFNANYGTGLSVFSFSKVTPKSNTFCSTVYFNNTSQLMKETMVLRDAFKHFITEIPIDSNYGEALKELQNFQKKLLDEY